MTRHKPRLRAYLIEALERRLFLAAGDLDGSFGVGGFVTGTGTPIVKLITAPAGVFALTQTEKGTLGQVDVVKLLPNGQPDVAYGVNGEVIFGAAGFEDTPIDIAPGPGDTIHVLAERNDSSPATQYVVRLTAAGAVDGTFNGGEVIVNTGSSSFGSLAVDGNGSVFVGGGDGASSYLISKYLSSGLSDLNFSAMGMVFVSGTTGANVQQLLIGPDGLTAVGSDFVDGIIFRRDPNNGAPITIFGSAGQVAIPGISTITSARIDSQGRIVVFGFDLVGAVVLRFDSGGAIDSSFGANGSVSLGSIALETMDIGPGDNIYITGSPGDSFNVLRLLGADGSADPAYGAAGLATVPIPGGSTTNGVSSIVTFIDGAALVAGGDFEVGDTFFIARLQGDVPPFAVLDTRTGLLTITGTAANDVLLVDVPNAATTLVTQLGPDQLLFPAPAVTSIVINTFAGADRVTLTFNVTVGALIDTGANPSTVLGGAGNDTIRGGGGADNIDGGPGDDSILGQGGIDNIRGGDGNDTIDTGSGGDFADGNNGNDSLIGGDGADTMDGAPGDDTLIGRAGDDQLFGADGNDLIIGELGNDTIDGSDGNDTIDGSGGNDVISGGPGANMLMGAAGADLINGGPDADTISGGTESDSLFGGAGNDLLSGAAGNDLLSGFDGNDVLDGGIGADSLSGENGDDSLAGGDDNDVIDAGAGNDTADGQAGDDSIIGAAGNDMLFGGIGNDELSGSAGSDTLDAGAGADRVFGGADNDTLMGGAGIDTLDGQLGTDFVSGGDNNDLLISDDGTIDQLNGDAGIDIARGDFDEDFVEVELLYRFV